MGIHIVVCMKQVPDPEGPQTSFEVDSATNRVVARGVPPVANPFDENALEAAIRIKESQPARVTLLSMGKGLSRAVSLKAMATGVDDAVFIDGDGLDSQELDSFTTARLLAAAIGREEFDLVLTGRQASDTNAGQVGLGIAQIMGIPAISLAQKIDVSEGKVLVESILPDGYTRMEAPLPALVTVSHEVGELRYPSLAAIKESKNLPAVSLSPNELGLDLTSLGTVRRLGLTTPSRERRCEIVSGETPEEAGEKLAERMHANGVV